MENRYVHLFFVVGDIGGRIISRGIRSGFVRRFRRFLGGGVIGRLVAGGGSCGGAIGDVLAAGCDTLVTADLKYNHFEEAKYRGLNLIDAGHFETENPVCAVLERLSLIHI